MKKQNLFMGTSIKSIIKVPGMVVSLIFSFCFSKNCIIRGIHILTLLFTIISTSIFCANAAVVYSPGSTLIEGELSPVNDPLLNALPTSNIVSSENAANISKIVVKDTIASPVSSPEANFSNAPTSFVTPNLSSADIVSDTLTQVSVTTKTPSISAPAYIIINANTKQIYGSKDANTKYEPAGIVNLMTAYLAATVFSMDDVLTVTNEATRQVDKDAFIAGLYGNDKITVRDAIASMFVRSCADSANVIAENVSGSIDEFVKLMNETAISFGCQNTNFVNPSGLNNDNQVTTAYDMALIMDKVTSNTDLAELLSLTTYTLPATKKREKLLLFSRNTQLSKDSPNYNPDVACSRMGYTSKTGYCLTSSANYKGNRFIAIILNAKGTQFDDTKKLIEFGKLAFEEIN